MTFQPPPPGAYEALMQFMYQAPIGLVQTTLDGDIVMINPMSAQLLMPLSPCGNLLNLFDVLSPLAPNLRELAAGAAPPGQVVCDRWRLALPDAQRRPGMPNALNLHLLRLDDTHLMATLSDATLDVQREQQAIAAQLHAATREDRLTAMPNRTALVERIDRELGRQQDEAGHGFAVVLFNADRFERINLMLGKPIGDAVLRLMASRILSVAHALQPGSAWTARLGGDEFAVVLGETSASLLAERTLEALARPYLIGDLEVHLTASAGATTASHSEQSAEELLQDATLAMQDAKMSGGSRYRAFDASMRECAQRRAIVEADLRQALAEGQLFVVYQPIIDLRTQALAGAEALVRWRHPERGIVPPIEFIEVAEATGLIGLLGEWMLNESCRQLVEWQRTLGALAPGYVSVNLSRAQITEPLIVDAVARALAMTGLPPASLQLEVTESLAAQGDGIRSRLVELKSLGLTLALDDFGTGYSSLASLHEMPIDVIKIDRSFVMDAVSSAHHRVLIDAVVMVARSLGMRTVAEGIETAEQQALLSRLECDRGQGYFISRPLAANDAGAWFAARREELELID
ncbi:MAG: bifunctional diguanylate cyclase/phosphodiesterase [Gammaproteobacteria bacterium]|nr:bifunctional diguanylate cyclase/phosphodiesterase [Gammaproteobacteria bacterium]MBU1439731.1 bifunctional diguanylate cyclase/phosphodiesterase [Gammaproteobacteria bacterium]